MSFQMRWSATPPSAILALFLGCIAMLALLPQMLAVTVTAKLAEIERARLGIFALVGLWGKRSPSEVTGAVGLDVLHWGIVVTFLMLVLAGMIVFAALFLKRAKNPQNKRGLASSFDAVKELGERQLIKLRAPILRPSVKHPKPTDVGFYAGEYHGASMWLRAEDPTILIGGSGSGKGVNFILPWILQAPGCVITTSNKMDNVQLTMHAKVQQGSDVRIFAPGVPGGEDLGHLLRWNPVPECLNEEVLVRRIKAFVPESSFAGGTSNGGHWDTLGQQLAAHLFHAAACAGGDVNLIWEWVGNPARAVEAVEAIRDHPQGLSEHANHLESVLQQAPEQRATSWGVLPTVLSFLESRAARKWLLPDTATTVDLVEFVLGKGTLYVVGDKGTSGGYLRIIDGLLSEIDYVTKGLADASPGSRLDPPVTYLLDEAGNFEYQGLPELITAGRGRGRVGVAVFQSRSQLALWGNDEADTMWDAAIAKIILPGGGDEKQLEAMSKLIGELWTQRESVTHGGSGGASLQVGEEKRAIFEASEIRTLADGHAILFYRRLKPVVLKLKPIFKYPEYKQLVKDSNRVAAQLREHSPFADRIRAFERRR